jgi:outer membrane protein, heavy metal efflux system
MQRGRHYIGWWAAAAWLLPALALPALALPAHAEDAVPVELGTTGLYLPNNALSQDKHYLEQDSDLLGRVNCLLQNMDGLLAELHALPPEREGAPETQPATAQELPQLIALALEHNPTLQPLRSQLAMQGAMARQAGAKPDPMAMFGISSIPLPQFELADDPMAMFMFGWSQEFVSYGKRGLKRQIASLDTDITELDISSAELDLISEISQQYFDLLATRARRDTHQQNIELLRLLLELAERKYALGLTPQAQVVRAQTALTQMELEQYKLEQQLLQQQQALYGALGRPQGFDPASLELRADYALPTSVALNQDAVLAELLRRRPDMQQLDLSHRQQAMRLELAQRDYRPDYTVSAQYGMRWGVRDLLNISVSIPVFTHKAERQDAAVEEQVARQDMLVQQRAELENELATRLGLMQIELDRNVELAQRYRSALVPQARLALDSMIAGYAANQTELDELLLAQADLLNYEWGLEELSIDYLASLTQLQVLTAGAFDPAPYLVQRDAAGMEAQQAQVELPASVEARVAGEERRQLDSLFLAPGTLPPGADDGAPPIGDGLVSTLDLPPALPVRVVEIASELARVVQQQAQTLQREAVAGAGLPSTTEAVATDAFYAPFEPGQTAPVQEPDSEEQEHANE